MAWARFSESQTRQAIEHPAGCAAATVLFGLVAGMQIPELLDPTVNFYKYVFAVVFGLLPVWQAYFLAKAIRQLRGGSELPSTGTQKSV